MQHLSLSHSGVPFLSGVPALVLARCYRVSLISLFSQFCRVSACHSMLSGFGCQSAIVFNFSVLVFRVVCGKGLYLFFGGEVGSSLVVVSLCRHSVTH